MKDFYFVRHGQTEANANGLMCGGKWDLPLNDVGIDQAKAALAALEKRRLDFQRICVSPLFRARQSAAILLQAFPQAVTQVIEDLREWDMGDWDRRPFLEVREEFLGDQSPRGGESRDELKVRVKRAMDHIEKLSGNSLVVSHGGVWMGILANLGLPLVRIENCAIKRVFLGPPGVGYVADLD